jgi:CRISPR-associated protein Cmr6
MTIAGPSWSVGASTTEAAPGHRFSLYFNGWNRDFTLGNDGKRSGLSSCCGLTAADRKLAQQLIARQHALAGALPVIAIDGTLTGPLATGLGMEHPVENGFAFATPYGLPYLPGSSVKGVVRSTAERMAIEGRHGWTLPAVWWLFGFDETSAWHDRRRASRAAFEARLRNVPREDLAAFGRLVPGGDDREQFLEDPCEWLLSCRPARLPRCRGALVFWDVIPETERLDVEVMTPHHSDYLQERRPATPLDSEEPNPIPFLVIPAGARVRFNVSLAPTGLLPDSFRTDWRELASLAVQESLEATGFGAKTAVGFGTGTVAGKAPLVRKSRDIILVTPGFLGGADPRNPKHTTLRASALKGHLRWWWRTTQIGHLTTAELRAVEDAIWGSVRIGKSPVRIRVSPLSPLPAIPAPFKEIDGDALRESRTFYAQRHIAEDHQALGYVAYGMAERRGGELLHRCVLPDRSTFTVDIEVTRPGRFEESGCLGGLAPLPADHLAEQVEIAWKLLCCFGAVGAKSRKGFGSLQESAGAPPDPQRILEEARRCATKLREELRLGARPFDPVCAGGAPSIDALAAAPVTLSLSSQDAWWVMNAVGLAMKNVASDWKHLRHKVVLGLPRQIHGPRNEPLHHQNAADHKRPTRLRGTPPVDQRHASPVHVCVRQSPSGALEVRVLAFVASKLPDEVLSRDTLRDYVGLLAAELRRVTARAPTPAPAPAPVPAPVRRIAPEQGSVQRVRLSGQTKKGGWKAQLVVHDATYEGPVLGTGAPPALELGAEFEVKVKSLTTSGPSPRQAQFEWIPLK